jgi:flagellin-specific chaperone FliS
VAQQTVGDLEPADYGFLQAHFQREIRVYRAINILDQLLLIVDLEQLVPNHITQEVQDLIEFHLQQLLLQDEQQKKGALEEAFYQS